MLDINLIRNNPEKVKASLLKKMDEVDFTKLLENDQKRRNILVEVESLKNQRNTISKKVGELKSKKLAVDPSLFDEVNSISSKIEGYEKELLATESDMNTFLQSLPNPPDDDILPGGKENNQVIRTFGEKPKFDFEPKNHMDLCKMHSLIDYERGVKLSGNGFWIYKGYGAMLEWALLNYFIENHIKSGYEFMLPPHILNYEAGFTAGQFPKFQDEVFKVDAHESRGQFMLPTAETALVNVHRDEILKEDELPKKYFAYTPCYRVEAGSAGTSERGMIRGHQFNKVELFQYTKPEDSDSAHEEMISMAENLLRGLGLHYQVSKLAARDCSASMARTYDVEIWIPSMNEYKEVSSASNARDYQARRGMMRFKRNNSKKTEYLHTLNASGLATSRLFPALIEQMQQSDGSILIPEPLRKWVGLDYIK
ncbi:MAG: serine--tRNA ligase [Oscillospiraceae bacterium]|nr:serine--tRNA ligase [Oscillospiraceae bacterium]